MEYTVEHVARRRALNDFLRLPYRVYEGNPHWVPPLTGEVRRTLNASKNPYFAGASLDLFLCRRRGVPVARTALVVCEAHCRRAGRRTGFFGFFESLDDREAVASLFDAVESRCRELRLEALEGPFNPNHYSELGLLADHYDEDQGFFEPYNPDYYHALLAAVGFAPGERLFTGRVENVRSYLRGRYGPPPADHPPGEYRSRCFDPESMPADLEKIRTVFNDAFSSNWHFIPTAPDEQRFASKYLKDITRPELVTIVEHRGEPVGVLLCVLDVNPLLRPMNGAIGPLKYARFLFGRKRIRTLVVYAVGIRKAYRGTRVFTLLLESLRRTADSFESMSCTWMHPENELSVRTAARVGLSEHKHLLIYHKRIPHPEGGTR